MLPAERGRTPFLLRLPLALHWPALLMDKAPPLQKRTASGRLYRRPPEVELELAQLYALDPPQRLEALLEGTCRLESLVHFLRSFLRSGDSRSFGDLFPVLAHLCQLNLHQTHPRARLAAAEEFHEEVLSRLGRLFAEDLADPLFKLDLFEARFHYVFKNLKSDMLRKHRRGLSARRASFSPAPFSPATAPEDDFLQSLPDPRSSPERTLEVYKLLEKLTADERSAVLHVYLEGHRQEDAARLLGISERTLRYRLRRAADKLARHY